MKIRDIINILDTISPFELQERWDNSGLNVGDMNREIKNIVLTLEVERDMLLNAEEETLFIAHHPLIFSGLKQLDFSKYPSNLLEIMVQRGLSLIAMHTNFDKTHLNRYVFEKVLGFKVEYQQDFICKCNLHISKDELFKILKSKLKLESLKVVAPKEEIKSLALTTGAGASLIDEVDVDCFLTGDIKYHDAMKAKSQDIMLIDIGHYESESFFAKTLQEELANLGISVKISNPKNPFFLMIH